MFIYVNVTLRNKFYRRVLVSFLSTLAVTRSPMKCVLFSTESPDAEGVTFFHGVIVVLCVFFP